MSEEQLKHEIEQEEHLEWPCSGCAFQKFEEGTGIQTGCKAGILEKYWEQGFETRLEEDGSLTIIDRVCTRSRGKNTFWYNIHGDKTLEEQLAIVRKEIGLENTCSVFVYCPEDRGLEEIERTIDTLKKQTTQLKEVLLVVSNKTIAPFTAIGFMNKKLKDTGIKFFVEFPTDVDQDTAMWLAKKKLSKNWMFFMVAGDSYPDTLVQNIDEKINDELERMLIVEYCGLPVFGKRSLMHITAELEPAEFGKDKEGNDLIKPAVLGPFTKFFKQKAEEDGCPEMYRTLSSLLE